MAKIILDCSVAISWFMPDESDGVSTTVLERIAVDGAVVPTLWHIEIGNALLVAQRNNRITSEQKHSALYSLGELPIITDVLTFNHAWQEAMELAESYSLSLYDATYLELALRMNLPLATFDNQLKKAAIKRKVEVI